MQTDLTIPKNLNNNNITFVNISCYLNVNIVNILLSTPHRAFQE